MRTYSSSRQLRQALNEERARGRRVSFVPTMGNLHEGHLQLVRKARDVSDIVVVSIFVNPMQFGPTEDLATYPRTLSADKEKLFAEGVQFLFTPTSQEIYPEGLEQQSAITVPVLSDTLCGAARPGHFTGVATVVTKLFNIVQPDVALFGEKDFQQLSIIRKMTRDLCLPIEIIGVPTARAADGLALSSRNGYLTPAQRLKAPLLNQLLQECREAIACGFDNYHELEERALSRLRAQGFTPDYFKVRDARTLDEVTENTEEVAILAAARLGKPRLIDNVRLSLNPVSDWGMLAVL